MTSDLHTSCISTYVRKGKRQSTFIPTDFDASADPYVAWGGRAILCGEVTLRTLLSRSLCPRTTGSPLTPPLPASFLPPRGPFPKSIHFLPFRPFPHSLFPRFLLLFRRRSHQLTHHARSKFTLHLKIRQSPGALKFVVHERITKISTGKASPISICCRLDWRINGRSRRSPSPSSQSSQSQLHLASGRDPERKRGKGERENWRGEGLSRCSIRIVAVIELCAANSIRRQEQDTCLQFEN